MGTTTSAKAALPSVKTSRRGTLALIGESEQPNCYWQNIPILCIQGCRWIKLLQAVFFFSFLTLGMLAPPNLDEFSEKLQAAFVEVFLYSVLHLKAYTQALLLA